MDIDKLKALASELAKDIKTPEDLSTFSAHLTKLTVAVAFSIVVAFIYQILPKN